MSLFGQTKRHSLSSKPGRRAPLPIFTSDAEKRYGLSGPGSPTPSTWYTLIYVPLPRLPLGGSRSSSSETLLNGGKAYHASHQQRRYCRLYVPLPPKVLHRIPRPSSVMRLVIGVVVLLVIGLFLLGFRKRPDGRNTWSPPFTDPNSLILTPEELAMIWEWEVSSGHYPNLSPIPENIPVSPLLRNPAVPETLLPLLSDPSTLDSQRTTTSPKSQLIGIGPERRFLTTWDSVDAHPGFPPRPNPGSIMDLDLVDERCNFGANKYVRDCLELLRVGGGLDNGKRVRRGNYLGTYKHLYFEDSYRQQQMDWSPRAPTARPLGLSRQPLTLDKPYPVTPSFDSHNPCDPLHPRVFHMFWAGPFTDKPYMAVASFLFTQNLGLDVPLADQSDTVKGTCRPQFWVWINPGPAAAVPNPSAKREMYEALATNPWSAPFLHERFRDVVKFRMWNTTEQLDGIPVLKDHWRDMQIFNSGGNVYKQPQQQTTTTSTEEEDSPKLGEMLERDEAETTEAAAQQQPKKKNGLFEKVGSASESDYDRLSVILSDMARFVLTHRFGGIYLDADTIFLRDWEELWNYRGQFAYRWSWHQKYNTAVLKMHKGSALSTFLFKTALENGLDFHPMTVSRYLKDADLEKLLFRVPDALFDPAWLNMERYQRERPPFPYFPEFSVFFSNDKFDTAGAQQVGYDGFFRGAFSYHFHNFWWLPFDPSRNFPDLGPRFVKGERALRDAQKEAVGPTDPESSGETVREDMDDEVDLSWSTVLKRTFEAYIRAERPNMYGEWLKW